MADIYCAAYITIDRLCLIPTPAYALPLHMRTCVICGIEDAPVLL